MKTIHFYVGLPRSGGTVLSSILNQNPEVYVASDTAMFEVLEAVDSTWRKTPTMVANPIPEQLENITQAVIDSMWMHRNESIIIDRNREWGHNMALSRKVFHKDIKVISTVRDLPSAMASWASLSKREYPQMDQKTIEDNIDRLWNTFVKHTVKSIVQLKGENVLFIDYDDLAANPRHHLSQIEDFLELPKHDYDLDNIQGDYQDRNIVPWGLKGMHKIRPKFEKISKPAQDELGPELYKKFQELDQKFKEDLSWK